MWNTVNIASVFALLCADNNYAEALIRTVKLSTLYIRYAMKLL